MISDLCPQSGSTPLTDVVIGHPYANLCDESACAQHSISGVQETTIVEQCAPNVPELSPCRSAGRDTLRNSITKSRYCVSAKSK